MKANKILILASAAIMGLAACGQAEEPAEEGKNLTRAEAETVLKDVATGKYEEQSKLTCFHKTGNEEGKGEDNITYVFDGEAKKAEITFAQKYTIKDVGDIAAGTQYFFSVGSDLSVTFVKKAGTTVQKAVIASNKVSELGVLTGTDTIGFAKAQVERFVKSGREHWHNSAYGISYYLQQQDILDAQSDKETIKVGTTDIEAGATISKKTAEDGTVSYVKGKRIKIVDEKYTQYEKSNRLEFELDALYPGTADAPVAEAKLHEPFKFKYDGNILRYWHNLKGTGNQWTMNYGVAEFTEPDTSSASTIQLTEAAKEWKNLMTVLEKEASIASGNLAQNKWPGTMKVYEDAAKPATAA